MSSYTDLVRLLLRYGRTDLLAGAQLDEFAIGDEDAADQGSERTAEAFAADPGRITEALAEGVDREMLAETVAAQLIMRVLFAELSKRLRWVVTPPRTTLPILGDARRWPHP